MSYWQPQRLWAAGEPGWWCGCCSHPVPPCCPGSVGSEGGCGPAGLTAPDVGSQCGLECGRTGGLCPWQLLPALPWQHICFLHFPIPAKGEPQPFWHQHKPRKNPSLNKTPFHWSLSLQAAVLSSMSVKAFTLSWTEHSLTKSLPC